MNLGTASMLQCFCGGFINFFALGALSGMGQTPYAVRYFSDFKLNIYNNVAVLAITSILLGMLCSFCGGVGYFSNKKWSKTASLGGVFFSILCIFCAWTVMFMLGQDDDYAIGYVLVISLIMISPSILTMVKFRGRVT